MPHTVDHKAILAKVGRSKHFVEQIDPRRTAHLVVDMQNGFMAPGAPVEVAQARGVVDEINRISGALREAGGLNVFIQYTTPGPNDPSWSNFAARLGPGADAHRDAFLPGTHHWQLWPGLDVRDGDLAVEKKRFSAFIQGSSEIESYLRGKGIDTILVGGTATNVCCESSARDASMLNFKTTMVSDALATYTDEIHGAALRAFYSIFGDVQTVDEAIASLERGRVQAAA